ncbi:MAG: hypothetical protein M1815_001611 [Lichina confinis]|nr:MAG: hypothetical protein M1815_001611 [Lichina confinis]
MTHHDDPLKVMAQLPEHAGALQSVASPAAVSETSALLPRRNSSQADGEISGADGLLSANITGYAVYQGLASSLDTLCGQAYGSGKKQLVGLQLQRMVYFLWCITIPIVVLWLNSTAILKVVLPEPKIAELAGKYLKVLTLGAPGYAAFESGKRFTQAQGLFKASTLVLFICAPLNMFLNWLFVWKFQWGSIGAPIAVVITQSLLPILLCLYVVLIDGRQCWDGFTLAAFRNWGVMIRIAIPDLLMVEAEFLAFELLTVGSSYFSVAHLAAQSAIATITCVAFLLHFPVSIAASTRIANLIGTASVDAAQMAAKVALVAMTSLGVFNMAILAGFRNYLPLLFTSDPVVVRIASGVLRIALPFAFGTGFGLGWKLYGFAAGMVLALGSIAAIEGSFIYFWDPWEQAVIDAHRRQILG